MQFCIPDIEFRPELSQFLPLARVDITATFIASFIFFDKGFCTSENFVLRSLWYFIIRSSHVITLPAKMYAQSLPDDTLFQQIDLLVVQFLVSFAILFDIL